jgi:subtilisin family serine protease
MNKNRTLNSFLSTIILMALAVTNFYPPSSGLALSEKSSQPSAKKPAFVPGVVLVNLRPGVTMSGDSSKGGAPVFETNSITLGETLRSLNVQSVHPLFPNLKNTNTNSKTSIELAQVYRLELPANADVMAAVMELSANSDVVYAEPDYIAYSTETSIFTFTPTTMSLVNDPLYGVQWGLAKINIEGAWDDTQGSSTITLAMIDSGIDLTHVDLADQLWVNPGEIPGNGLDDDSNGYIDDINGWNFVAGSNDVSDDNGHGTLVSGVAAAIANNGQGVAGVCPQCSIMPVKVMQASGVANYSDIAVGVLYAAQKGTKVINLSLGGYANSNTLHNAIDAAVNTYGVVVVAGSGNDNLNQLFYPAAYDNVLAVAGTQNDDTKASFSNYGTWVDVSAPAVDIRTTALGGDWVNSSGTSMGAPFATGLAGLLRTLHPTWNQATIRSQIIHTTDSIESANPAYAGKLGSGRLNAGTAMQAPTPVLSMVGYSVNGQANGRPTLGATAQLNATLSNDWWNALGVMGTLSTTDSYVTIINGSTTYGDIAAGTSKANATAFSFSVASGAGYNHPIPFTLAVTDTTGYSNSFNFTINTETGIENKSGTLTTQTWTNDKTYLITNNVSIPTGNTLTIQPGTMIKFDGNYALSVRGTLIADGTSSQPIQFKSNTAGTWDKIFFDDLNIDAQADVDGTYISGTILRYVNIEGETGGITCTTATPYLSHVNLNGGGIVCSLGATPLWFLDNTISGGASFTGAGSAYRNSVSGSLGISGSGIAEDNIVNGGGLSLGSGQARRNTITGGSLSVGGSGGTIENNTVSGGNINAGSTFNVAYNTITGSLGAGDGSTVDHNTVSNGITVGSSATTTWNNVENASGTGLSAGSNVIAQYNRLIGNLTGMTASTGLIEHNLIANNTGVGLQVGAATVRYNTFTGNKGNTIVVQGGNPVTIEYNNLEGNTGTYDLYVNIPGGVTVLAENNWWGTTDTTVIDTRIWDYWEDDTKAEANYLPLLTEPDQTAPAYVRGVTVLPDTTLGIQTGTFEAQFSKPMDANSTSTMIFYNTKSGNLEFYTQSNSGLPDNQVRDIAVDLNRIKWFATRYGGVASFDGVSWHTYNTSNSSLPDNTVLAIAIGQNGTKWFGTLYGGVASFDGTNWRIFNATNSRLPCNTVHSIAVEQNGTEWFGACGKVASFDGSSWHVYDSTNSGLPETDYINAIAIEQNGTKWFSVYDKGVASFDGTTWHVFNMTNSGLPVNWLAAMAIGQDGTKWFGFNGEGVASFDGVNWVTYNSMAAYVFSIADDDDENGIKWFGTAGGGVIGFNGSSWISYNSGLPDSMISIAMEQGGNKWVGSWNSGAALRYGDTKYLISDNSQWLSPSNYRATFDITSAIPKYTYRVSISESVDSDGMRIAPYSNATFSVDYTSSISDTTPPTKPIVRASGDGSLSTILANWSSNDPDSLIDQYRYAIGTTPGGRDVVAWTYIFSGTTTSMTRTGLNLTYGQVYYVTVGARNEGGLWSESGISNSVVAGIPTNITVTLISSAAQDGWILESGETTGQGGTINTKGAAFNLGDDSANKQYRSILSFDTSSIPDNAVIVSVELKIMKSGLTGTDPFTTHGNLIGDVRKGAFSNNNSLQTIDFNASASKKSAITFSSTPVDSWYSAIMTSLNFTYINLTGVTQFRLRFSKDDNNDRGADFLKFYSGNSATVSFRPVLIIVYTLP